MFSVPFAIDEENGRIFVSQRLDLELNTEPHYNLKLNISDFGLPMKFIETEVSINVLDVNDKAPEFTSNVSEKTFFNIYVKKFESLN